MINHSSGCWTFVPLTVEYFCQQLLNIHANDCWIIVPETVEQSCQRLLNIRASVTMLLLVSICYYCIRRSISSVTFLQLSVQLRFVGEKRHLVHFIRHHLSNTHAQLNVLINVLIWFRLIGRDLVWAIFRNWFSLF